MNGNGNGIIRPKTLDGSKDKGSIDVTEHLQDGTPYIRLDVEPSPQLLTAVEAMKLAQALAAFARRMEGLSS